MMESAKPQKEHAFLQRLVGEWEMVSSTGYDNFDPDDPEQRFTESVRSIGGVWIISDGKGKMPDGTPMEAVITLGFDPAKGQYVGTWVGSMMANLWVYKGWLELDGKTLTLEAEGPSFDGTPGTSVYHDVVTLHDDNRRSFSGSVRQPDGSFKEFMSSELRRKQ